jgi:hypothetical protein
VWVGRYCVVGYRASRRSFLDADNSAITMESFSGCILPELNRLQI